MDSNGIRPRQFQSVQESSQLQVFGQANASVALPPLSSNGNGNGNGSNSNSNSLLSYSTSTISNNKPDSDSSSNSSHVNDVSPDHDQLPLLHGAWH